MTAVEQLEAAAPGFQVSDDTLERLGVSLARVSATVRTRPYAQGSRARRGDRADVVVRLTQHDESDEAQPSSSTPLPTTMAKLGGTAVSGPGSHDLGDLTGLVEGDDEAAMRSHTSGHQKGAVTGDRQGHSDLIDDSMLPDWLRGARSETSIVHANVSAQNAGDAPRYPSLIDQASLPAWLRGDQGEAPGIEDEDTHEYGIPPVGSTHRGDSGELPAPGELRAASLFGAQSQPLDGLGAYGAHAPAQRHEMTAEDRATAEEENESILLNFIGQLESRWRDLNSPSSQVPVRERRRAILAFAGRRTGLGPEEMNDILDSRTWENARHDIAAMLHTDGRYRAADELMQRQLGVSLEDFLAFSIKAMEGDFYANQRYAAGMSIRNTVYGYLNWYNFRLPIRTHLTQAFAEVLPSRDRQPARPVTRDERTIVSRVLDTGIGQRARSLWAGFNEWRASLFSDENDGQTQSASNMRPSTTPAYARALAQPSTSASVVRRTPAPQLRATSRPRPNDAQATGPRGAGAATPDFINSKPGANKPSEDEDNEDWLN